jgi:hypothetical protein
MLLNITGQCNSSQSRRYILGPFPVGTLIRKIRIVAQNGATGGFSNTRLRAAMLSAGINEIDTQAKFSEGRQLIRNPSQAGTVVAQDAILCRMNTNGVNTEEQGQFHYELAVFEEIGDRRFVGVEATEITGNNVVEITVSIDAQPPPPARGWSAE